MKLTTRTGHPDFLDLPWDTPLASWKHERLRDMPMGIHRHVVRTVQYDDRLYHLKELPGRLAEREWRLLRHLQEQKVPVVRAVGVVRRGEDDPGTTLDAVLITEHLEFSVPYRLLFQRTSPAALREPILDALVHLLVRLHLNGFLWGDCSLSNTLFRRDAGRLAAYLVDAETGELHPELSPGQRALDIELAVEKCGGEVMDLQAAGVLSFDVDPHALGDELRGRYHGLWNELTADEVFTGHEHYRIQQRLERINALGYDVEELELLPEASGRTRLRIKTSVLEPGRYRRLLHGLVGLDVEDNQACRLLNDIHDFGAWLQQHEAHDLPSTVISRRWLESHFEPVIAQIPADLRARRAPAEIYSEVLEHWGRWSAEQGTDLELTAAARRFADDVLRTLPDERHIPPAHDGSAPDE